MGREEKRHEKVYKNMFNNFCCVSAFGRYDLHIGRDKRRMAHDLWDG